MKLKSVRIENFKKVEDVTLDLADLNVIVGTNASGKSSIIQAIHFASCLARQVPRIDTGGSTIQPNQLDYLPTENYKKLGNEIDWGTNSDTSHSLVKFTFLDDNGDEINTFISARQAKNSGISVRATLPQTVSAQFRGKEKFFTTYIPGISGVPNEEQKLSKRVVLKGCSFGDANFYLRNALLLISADDRKEIENWLSGLIGDLKLKVSHNNEEDLTVQALVEIDCKELPLELLGMGYIQLIQIFCYIKLFNPKVLLIDEPDIHLHPSVQEKLSQLLSRVAKETGIKIILSTHSPFIVRGAPHDANVYWMQDGAIQNSDRDAIELDLGWGAFGKKIILFSEDKNTDLLRHILAQWLEIETCVAIHPGNGYGNLPKPEEAKELYNTFNQSFKIVIHRDRDSMTDDEASKLRQIYDDNDVNLWLTDHSDIESYFCEPQFLEGFLNISQQDADDYLAPIISSNNDVKHQKFVSQRRTHNSELHSDDGGSPKTEDVWDELQQRPLKACCGKEVFKHLKNKVQSNQFSEGAILAKPLSGNVAPSLKYFLETLL